MTTTRKRVLVVDDDEALMESVAMFVMHVGHTAVAVSSGVDA